MSFHLGVLDCVNVPVTVFLVAVKGVQVVFDSRWFEKSYYENQVTITSSQMNPFKYQVCIVELSTSVFEFLQACKSLKCIETHFKSLSYHYKKRS